MAQLNDKKIKEKERSSNNLEMQKSRHGNVYQYDDSFLEGLKNSRFWLVRAIYFMVASIWTVVMIVGGFIAWLISWLLL